MKIQTNLKSGVSITPTSATSTIGDQVSSFFNSADQQAANLSNKVANILNSQKQGLSNLLGLS